MIANTCERVRNTSESIGVISLAVAVSFQSRCNVITFAYRLGGIAPVCLRGWILYVAHGVVLFSWLLPKIGETTGLYFACVAVSFAYGIRLWLYKFYSLVGFVFAMCVVGGGKSEKRKRARVSNLVYPFSDFFKI